MLNSKDSSKTSQVKSRLFSFFYIIQKLNCNTQKLSITVNYSPQARFCGFTLSLDWALHSIPQQYQFITNDVPYMYCESDSYYLEPHIEC